MNKQCWFIEHAIICSDREDFPVSKIIECMPNLIIIKIDSTYSCEDFTWTSRHYTQLGSLSLKWAMPLKWKIWNSSKYRLITRECIEVISEMQNYWNIWSNYKRCIYRGFEHFIGLFDEMNVTAIFVRKSMIEITIRYIGWMLSSMNLRRISYKTYSKAANNLRMYRSKMNFIVWMERLNVM